MGFFLCVFVNAIGAVGVVAEGVGGDGGQECTHFITMHAN